MTSLPKIAFRSSSPPARPASRVSPWHAALLGLLVLGALLVLGGCLAEEGTGPVDPSSYTFAADIEPILTDAKCYNCHGVSQAPGGTCNTGCHNSTNAPACSGSDCSATPFTDLTRATMVGVTSLTATGNIVTVGSSATSTLWQVVSGDGQYSTNGGAMLTSMGTNSLSTSDKSTIQGWIDYSGN
jgi:hypothetical protein